MKALKIFFNKPNLIVGLAVFFFYLFFLVAISEFYKNIPLFLIYADTINWVELGISFFLSLVIGILIAINAALLYSIYKRRMKCAEGGLFAGVGAVGGAAAGICPICVTGLLPIGLGIFGITFSFASLPFKGLELQIFSILLLVISLFILNRKI